MAKMPYFLNNWPVKITIVGIVGMTTTFFLYQHIELNGIISRDTNALIPKPTGTIHISTTGIANFTKGQMILEAKNCSGFHLIEFFPVISVKLSLVTDLDLLLRREKEYMDTLISNLKHPVVCQVYVFSDRPEDLRKLLVKNYGNIHPNLTIHKSGPSPLYEDIFRFASENLLNKVVMVLNADIQLGKGFDKVDKNWWKDHPKTMHALTRQLPLNRCRIRRLGDYCTHKRAKYIGSHDVFLFYLKDPFPDKFLKVLNFSSNHLGSENVLMWAFHDILKFRVTNPCLKLFAHHNHCSGLKSHTKSKKVSVEGRLGVANYGDVL